MKTKKFRFMISGFIIGAIFSAGLTVYATSSISSAKYSSSKMYFYNKEIPISQQPVLIEDGSTGKEKLYFPIELMEYMNFDISMDKQNSKINITMKGNNSQSAVSKTNNYKSNNYNSVLEIMQKTGNWKYVEPYLFTMTNDGIDEVVKCYNSKHQNINEHKNSSDYYNK